MYFHAAADGTALYIGDPVIKSSSADPSGPPERYPRDCGRRDYRRCLRLCA
jgi:hypothetical protein